MLRVSARRLSSLSWRRSATASIASRNPITGSDSSSSDDSGSFSPSPYRIAIESGLLHWIRGFSSEALIPQHSNFNVPATVSAIKNPASKITYDEYNHERFPPGDPSKHAFAYVVLSGGCFVYASLLCLLVLKLVLSMSALKDILALALASLEVDLSSIEPGSTVTVKWRGLKPVFIRRRTEDDIKLANSVDLRSLRDPQEDSARLKNPE